MACPMILVSGHEVLARRPTSKVQVTLSVEHGQLRFLADGVIGQLRY